MQESPVDDTKKNMSQAATSPGPARCTQPDQTDHCERCTPRLHHVYGCKTDCTHSGERASLVALANSSTRPRAGILRYSADRATSLMPRQQRVALPDRLYAYPDDARRAALVLWFNELGMGDVGLVGGKNASLGEMYRQLTPRGVTVPNGFAVTATAYRQFIAEAGIEDYIRGRFDGLDITNMDQLQHVGADVRGTILHATVRQHRPDSLRWPSLT